MHARGNERPRSPEHPPPPLRRRSGAKRKSPEPLEDEVAEDGMGYDEETRTFDLLAEAISFMSAGKGNVDRWEDEAILKFLNILATKTSRTRWMSWTDGLLEPLKLLEVVRQYNIPTDEVEAWTNTLRIWYERTRSDQDGVPEKSARKETKAREEEPNAVSPEREETVDVEDNVPLVDLEYELEESWRSQLAQLVRRFQNKAVWKKNKIIKVKKQSCHKAERQGCRQATRQEKAGEYGGWG